MESKWGYQLTQKADADLDDIVGYIAVELANSKAASDFDEKMIFVLRIIYGRRNMDEILRQLNV